MGKRNKKLFKKDIQEKLLNKKSSESPTKGNFLLGLILPAIFIIPFLYVGLRDNSIPDSELSTINVTLKEDLEYEKNKYIILVTKEYQREFRITGMTYKATNHDYLDITVFKENKIQLKVKKSELDELNENSFVNNYNNVYGLSKNGVEYIDLKLRTKLTDRASIEAFLFVIFGLVALPYAFIKKEPRISLETAMQFTACFFIIIFIILLIISK